MPDLVVWYLEYSILNRVQGFITGKTLNTTHFIPWLPRFYWKVWHWAAHIICSSIHFRCQTTLRYRLNINQLHIYLWMTKGCPSRSYSLNWSCWVQNSQNFSQVSLSANPAEAFEVPEIVRNRVTTRRPPFCFWIRYLLIKWSLF